MNSHIANNAGNGIDSYKSNIVVSYNNIQDNVGYGVFNHLNLWWNIYAPNNHWGCPFGPFHPLFNPIGMGNPISDYVEFQPFAPIPIFPVYPRIAEIRANEAIEFMPVIPDLEPIVVPASETPLIEIRSHGAFNPTPTRLNLGVNSPPSIRVDEVQEDDWKVIYPDQVTPKPLGCGAAWTSDWLASAFVTTKLSDFVEGLDTNSSFVNQTTGEAIGENGTEIVTFGGPFVNPVVKRAENTSTPDADRAPVKFHSESGIFYFQYKNGTNIPNASLPVSVINNDQDLFVIERYMDGDGRIMTISYGFGWPGTYAAGKYFDQVVYPNFEAFIYRWIIVKWEDSNGDGFVNNPGKGDTYTLIATG